MTNDNIVDTIKNLFEGADEQNWQKVKSAFAKEVLLDYSSMNGNEPLKLTPDKIVDAWAAFLPGFDSTHHRLSDFTVHINKETATAHYKGNAKHFLNSEVWVVEGTYDTQLKWINGIWLITALKLNFTQQSGNTDLPALATQRMQKQKQE